MATAIGIRTLLGKLQARLQALTAGLALMNRAGEAAALGVYVYRIPNNLLEDDSEREYPYLVLRHIAGGDGESKGLLKVRCFVGLFNSGADFAGEEDLESVLDAILQLPLGQEFSPYFLQPGTTFQFGDVEEGRQSIDKFYMTADLSFSREAFYLNY